MPQDFRAAAYKPVAAFFGKYKSPRKSDTSLKILIQQRNSIIQAPRGILIYSRTATRQAGQTSTGKQKDSPKNDQAGQTPHVRAPGKKLFFCIHDTSSMVQPVFCGKFFLDSLQKRALCCLSCAFPAAAGLSLFYASFRPRKDSRKTGEISNFPRSVSCRIRPM